MSNRTDHLSRMIPPQPWPRIVLSALILVVAGLTFWEMRMRQIGLRPGDLGDGLAHWSVERGKIDRAETNAVAIILMVGLGMMVLETVQRA